MRKSDVLRRSELLHELLGEAADVGRLRVLQQLFRVINGQRVDKVALKLL